MAIKTVAMIPANETPQEAPTRQIRYRYPWDELVPGAAFEFAPHVKILSARVMCANNGINLRKQFRCFRGMNGKLYARRVDGWTEPQKAAKSPQAPVFSESAAPTEAEVFGTFGHKAPDNVSNIVDPPPYSPVLPEREVPYDLPNDPPGQRGHRHQQGPDISSNEAALARLRGEEII